MSTASTVIVIAPARWAGWDINCITCGWHTFRDNQISAKKFAGRHTCPEVL